MPKLLNWFSGVQTYFTVGLLVATLAASTGWYITSLQLDSCKAGRTADQASYKAAQEQATVIALLAKAAEEKRNEQRRLKADDDYRALSARYHDALGLYREAQRKARNANLPGETPTSEGPNGPGENTLVPTRDLETCADNTARLESARRWALDLIN